jgi:Subtilase family
MVPSDDWSELTAQDLPWLGRLWALPLNEQPPWDPNLIWWDLTAGRHFTPPGPVHDLPVLAQARPGAGGGLAALEAAGLFGVAPEIAKRSNPFFTGFVRPSDLERLLQAAERVQIGLAAVPLVFAGPSDTYEPLVEQRRKPLIGVIDDGFAFLNKCFAEDPKQPGSPSRLRWLWDQGRAQEEAQNRHWTATPFGYGAQLTNLGFADAQAAALRYNEAAGYRAIDYLVDQAGLLPRYSHGTHIAGLAAGAIDRLIDWCASGNGGVANGSDIAAVALPAASVADTSGRSLVVHVLNAVHFILSRAQTGQHVVINLSLGQYGGPHDGSAMLAHALAELVQREWATKKGRRLVITIGAGNGYLSKTHGHSVLAAGGTQQFVWHLPTSDPTDTLLEVWSEAPSLHARITASSGQAATVALGKAQVLRRSGQVVACANNLVSTALGDGPLLHVAAAPTRPLDGGSGSSSGDWAIELNNPSNKACSLDAWVDRDDAPLGSIGITRPQSRLFNAPGGTAFVSDVRTMSGMAEPKWLVVAGASVLKSKGVAPYSASGHGRAGLTRTPWVAMPADESPAVPGLPVPGVVSGAVERLSGTSVASALLAREAANILAAPHPPTDWTAFRATLIDAVVPPGTKPPPDPRVGAGVADSTICKRP